MRGYGTAPGSHHTRVRCASVCKFLQWLWSVKSRTEELIVGVMGNCTWLSWPMSQSKGPWDSQLNSRATLKHLTTEGQLNRAWEGQVGKMKWSGEGERLEDPLGTKSGYSRSGGWTGRLWMKSAISWVNWVVAKNFELQPLRLPLRTVMMRKMAEALDEKWSEGHGAVGRKEKGECSFSHPPMTWIL